MPPGTFPFPSQTEADRAAQDASWAAAAYLETPEGRAEVAARMRDADRDNSKESAAAHGGVANVTEEAYAREIGRRLQAFTSSSGSYDHLGPDATTWSEGGCWLLAEALRQVVGGELVSVVDANGHPQHAAVRLGGVYLDGDGAASLEEFERRWREVERVPGASVAPFSESLARQVGMDPIYDQQPRVVGALRDALARVVGYAAVEIGGQEAPRAREKTPPETPAAESVSAPVGRFRPTSQEDLAPSGEVARARANIAALTTLRTLERDGRRATEEEQRVLARWSGWGALPAVFDQGAAGYDRFAWAREDLGRLLSGEELAAAARTTINAHYTDISYVDAIWDAVRTLGFDGGQVLEPGCGCGNFLAAAPDAARVVGVELDPVTAAIAAAIHPDAQIRAESFADTRIPEGAFDAVVGNVPFGDVVLHDPRHNVSGHRIHNHFIVKSLHLTRPGGIVAVLTSRYTMDAANPAARREIAGLADLVGAVRLPTGAHRRAAGTDVVTDVLVLRRREEGREPSGAAFEQSERLALAGADDGLRVNEYFLANPRHVLGALRATQADLGRVELEVAGDRAAGPALAEALGEIARTAAERGLAITPRSPASAPSPLALVAPETKRPDGYLVVHENGTFGVVRHGAVEPHEPPARQAPELRALLGLRDTVVALLEAEAKTIDDTAEIAALRAQLNARHDRYVEAYGPANRFTWRSTGRVNPETGEARLARISPPQGGFRSDPFWKVVYALEVFDPESQRASKAAIFRQRVVARRAPRLGADTPADALAICLDSVGEVRLGEVARLLGVPEKEAREKLRELVFDEPGTERLVPSAEYLSGNVREKLMQASAAAAEDARFAPNVAALTAVIPRDLGPDEISAKMGAAWIDEQFVRQFLVETLEDQTVQVEHPGGAIWAVKSWNGGSVLATNRWGTERCNALDIAHALLEQRPIRIYDVDREGNRTFNAAETVAAVEKASEMAERFSEWLWEDPERASALARTYNDRFNCIVLRTYDDATLSLPGLAMSIKPRPHQIAAVARIINEPAVGLFHEVGAGKTLEMVMGAMELRRLGLVNKPCVVVPNHMLEQFTSEWLQAYPQAKLLAASGDDLGRDRRQLFVAKTATGDWDAIVMTRGAFERIEMSPDAQKRYLEREVQAITEMLERSKGSGGRLTLKRLEKAKVNAEERLKKKLDGAKDVGITFEQTGIDYLFVDEAHAYKNLRNVSHIPGMAVDGSMRASDLHMKIEHLREEHGRVATLATATPIANSMGEAFTMQRFLRPDLLAAAGITDFDVWAATFGETTTAIEVAPDGSGMRMATRFAKFRNVPELLMQWRVSADIKTADDLKLPVPDLALRASDGQRLPETVVVPPSAELKEFVAKLAERAEDVRGRLVRPEEDNMLRISSDGRAAALSLRLVGAGTTEPQKGDVAAEKIAEIYAQHRDAVYPGMDGRPHPRHGALQLVFADLGTPTPGEWSVYEQLRSDLVERGLPRDGIRFVHEARNDKEKGELFQACRDGRVSVLIGSTEKMGVGTNVQLRAVALHHLDCPWRPADLAQREGRIVRQGNANPEVRVLRYVTEGSFDAYSWQTVTRKAQFIAQVMRGRLDVREIEDVGDVALSYNEVKALATGNPLLLDQARHQAEVSRLERLERAHRRSQDSLRWTMRESANRINTLAALVAQADVALTRRRDVKGDAFEMTVGERTYEKRTDAGDALRRVLAREMARSSAQGKRTTVGSFGGFPVTSSVTWGGDVLSLALEGVPGSEIALSDEEVLKAALCARLENKVMGIEAWRANAQAEVKRLLAEHTRAESEIGKPFKHGPHLEEERAKLREVDEAIRKMAEPPAPVVAPAGEQGHNVAGAGEAVPAQEAEGTMAAGAAAAASPPATCACGCGSVLRSDNHSGYAAGCRHRPGAWGGKDRAAGAALETPKDAAGIAAAGGGTVREHEGEPHRGNGAQVASDEAAAKESLVPRRELEEAIWAATHPEYRSVMEHQGRAVLVLDDRGATVLSPLATMGNEELRALADKLRPRAREAASVVGTWEGGSAQAAAGEGRGRERELRQGHEREEPTVER